MSRGGTAALVAAAGCRAVRSVAADGALACVEMQGHYTDRWGQLYFPEWIIQLVPQWHKDFTLWLVRTLSEWRQGYKYAIVERAAARLRQKPVLLISGARDTYVNPEITQRLHARTGQAAATGLWIVPGAKHNMSREKATREYDDRLVKFFSTLDSATPGVPGDEEAKVPRAGTVHDSPDVRDRAAPSSAAFTFSSTN
jgi:pimeloyl-ACP methyl ester carboxylesterase